MKMTINQLKELLEDSTIVAVEQSNESDCNITLYVQSNDTSFPMKALKVTGLEIYDAIQMPIIHNRIF